MDAILKIMLYQEVPVSPALQSFVQCYWKFIGPIGKPVELKQHFIAPDACTSLVFFTIPSLEILETSLFGPTKYITETSVMSNSLTLGIRFKPGYSWSLFGMTGEDLRDKNIRPAPNCLSLDKNEVFERIKSKKEAWEYFNSQLPRALINKQPTCNPVVDQAAYLILQSEGNIKISQLLKKIPLSERQLQKVFKKEVGLSLKEFAITMRLRAAIIKLELENENYQDTIFDAGYYDQAHFIRDFSKVSKISLPDFKKYIRNIKHVNVSFRQ
jgi:methylphosphotriester-DNA--protein-cysteine methyltransferase